MGIVEIGQLVGWYLDCLIACLVDWLADCLIDRMSGLIVFYTARNTDDKGNAMFPLKL